MGKYVIQKSSNGQYWWVLKAANGETILKSEMYNSKQASKGGIESSKINIADCDFNRLFSKIDQPYFTQRAANHQIIGTSQMYSSISARDGGIESVKKNASGATIEDLTEE